MFVAINRRLSLWRFDRVPVSSPVKRFFEALVVAAIVCAFTFGFSYAFGSCAPRPSADAAEPYLDDLVSFYCSADEFNELGRCGGLVEYDELSPTRSALHSEPLHGVVGERNQAALSLHKTILRRQSRSFLFYLYSTQLFDVWYECESGGAVCTFLLIRVAWCRHRRPVRSVYPGTIKWFGTWPPHRRDTPHAVASHRCWHVRSHWCA